MSHTTSAKATKVAFNNNGIVIHEQTHAACRQGPDCLTCFAAEEELRHAALVSKEKPDALSRPRDHRGRFISLHANPQLPPEQVEEKSHNKPTLWETHLIVRRTFRVDWGTDTPITLLRYPGGKQRVYYAFSHLLPAPKDVNGCYVEPFVGGGSVFFLYNPDKARLADLNPELIGLYMAVRDAPHEVWSAYSAFPTGRDGYYQVRRDRPTCSDIVARAARTLYLSRTCFKGQWRTNAQGDFNIGYGGADRRKVVTLDGILEASARLQGTQLRVADFEKTINACKSGDLLYCDPPYRPGAKELLHQHYLGSQFAYEDHCRLALALGRATSRGVRWVLTTTGHPAVTSLYADCQIYGLQRGRRPVNGTGEVVITNEGEGAPW